MKHITRLLLVLALSLMVTGIAVADGGTLRTTFEVRDANGQSVGTVTLTQQADGVLVEGHFRNLSAGEHGIHFHAVGTCTPDFSAAGPHFNPGGDQHGFNNPAGPHAGDLVNLEIGADGTGHYSEVTTLISLRQGDGNSVYDADGTAVIVHANADDYVTDPSGNSGDRIACGVVSPATAARLPDTGSTSQTWALLAVAAGALLVSGTVVLRRAQAMR